MEVIKNEFISKLECGEELVDGWRARIKSREELIEAWNRRAEKCVKD